MNLPSKTSKSSTKNWRRSQLSKPTRLSLSLLLMFKSLLMTNLCNSNNLTLTMLRMIPPLDKTLEFSISNGRHSLEPKLNMVMLLPIVPRSLETKLASAPQTWEALNKLSRTTPRLKVRERQSSRISELMLTPILLLNSKTSFFIIFLTLLSSRRTEIDTKRSNSIDSSSLSKPDHLKTKVQPWSSSASTTPN